MNARIKAKIEAGLEGMEERNAARAQERTRIHKHNAILRRIRAGQFAQEESAYQALAKVGVEAAVDSSFGCRILRIDGGPVLYYAPNKTFMGKERR